MKIIHCADLHLDSKMESNLDREAASMRRDELLDTFERMVTYAAENEVRVILIAGDLFDKPNVRKAAKTRVIEQIKQHPEIDFCYIRGNHDQLDFVEELSEQEDITNLKLFGTDEWTSYDYGDVVITGMELVKEKIDMAKAAGVKMIAMDIDAAGLPFLKNMTPPAGSKTVEELKEIISYAGVPFILKGIMTVNGAKKALEAGAAGIVVSNHGGRVLDQCPATAEVLPEIVEAVGGKMTILVDGGIRSGADVFNALALGADGVVIARPFVTAVYGGEKEGVRSYIEKIGSELEDTMKMCGVSSLNEINRDCVFVG